MRHARGKIANLQAFIKEAGESDPVGTRTRDLRIKSPLLYQLSYRVSDSPSFHGPNGSGKGRTNESSKLSPIDKRRRRGGTQFATLTSVAESQSFASRCFMTKNIMPDRSGKAGWILLWLLGVPIPILLILFVVRGCT